MPSEVSNRLIETLDKLEIRAHAQGVTHACVAAFLRA